MCLEANLTVSCEDQQVAGGITRLYIASRASITDFVKGAEYAYTSVSMASSADIWYVIEGDDFTTSLAGAGQVADTNAKFRETTITLNLSKIEKIKSGLINDLESCCKVVVIAETAAGNAIVIGWDERLKGTAALNAVSVATIGADLADGNFFTLNLTGRQVQTYYDFEGTIQTLAGAVTLPA